MERCVLQCVKILLATVLNDHEILRYLNLSYRTFQCYSNKVTFAINASQHYLVCVMGHNCSGLLCIFVSMNIDTSVPSQSIHFGMETV